MNTDARSIELAWPSARRAWYAVAVLQLAYICSFVDRTLLALLVQPIKADLGLSDTQISLLHGLAFAVFYTFLGLPIGWLADRYSRRRIISVGVALWSVMTATCGLAGKFWHLFLARMGVGVGEAALSPAAFSMLADYFPPSRLGRAIGTYSAGIYIGAGLAFIIGGAVVAAVTHAGTLHVPLVGDVQPWQLTFFLVGLPGLFLALLVLTVREPPRRGARAQGKITDVVRHVRKNARAILCHFVGFALLSAAFNVATSWAPTYFVRQHGLAAGDAGTWLGLEILFFGGAGIVTGGWLADLLRERGRSDGAIIVGVISGISLTPFAIAAPLMATATSSLIAYAPFMFFSSLSFGAAAAAVQLITPNALRAQTSALYLFVNNLLGIGLGPLVTALVTDHVLRDERSVGTSMAIVAGAAAFLAAVVLCAGRRSYRESLATASMT